MFLILFIAIVSLVSFKLYSLLNVTSNTSEKILKIEQGESLRRISDRLFEERVIKSSKYFMFYTKVKGMEKSIKAGKYTIPPNIGLDHLLEQLQKPNSEYVAITIPEGYTLHQIAAKMDEVNLINRDSFISQEFRSQLIPSHNSGIFYELEGYLFPDTYYIPPNSTEGEIVDIMHSRFRTVFNEEYGRRAEELGLSINEIVTIASLIEREAANDEERKSIAGVIYNRQKKAMPLQIDATVIYGITKGERNMGRVLYKDLEVDTKYNTYIYIGLPPGPISSPGKASIEAALYPENNDFLYYVLGEKGHIFSRTYEEHLLNKNRSMP